MTATFPPGHRHVSERKTPPWTDCTWCSGVMFSRQAIDLNKPATLAEALALRTASRDTGGSNITNLIDGIRARYGSSTGTKVNGFAALWAALKPGNVAAVQGSMGAFAYGNRMRRFDPAFAGGHCVFVYRSDSSDTVWWDDPLAPTGAYLGEPVSKAQLAAFVNKLPGGASLVAPRKEPVVNFAPVSSQVPAIIDVLPGAALLELDGATVIKTVAGTYRDQLSPFAVGPNRAWFATLGGVLRPVVVRTASNIRPVVDTTPYSKAAYDAAVVAQKAADDLLIVGAKAVGASEEKGRIRQLLGL